MNQGQLDSLDIISRGLEAQRVRSEVITRNIANAYATRTPDGGPYRRQVALLEAVGSGADTLGVRVTRIDTDPSPFTMVEDSGHPDRNADGYVAYPNVEISKELVDLVDAGRAYEANLAALRVYRTMLEQTLEMNR